MGGIPAILLSMQSRPSRLSLLAIATLAVFTVWITWRAKALESGLEGGDETAALLHKPAPEFNLTSLGGSSVSLAEFRGKKKVVITYWASWCGPCRLEMPTLRAFYNRMHKEDSKFEFLAISIDDDRDPAERYAAQSKLPFPVLLDSAKTASAAYGVNAIPATFVVDENGTVIYAHTGLEPAMEIVLVRELGIKNYKPAMGVPNADAGH
jgi:peroxiredoxin